jgi:hypothetical protein
MNKIKYLIHMTNIENLQDILYSGFLYPQSITGIDTTSINETDRDLIFTSIVTKDDNDLGINQQNVTEKRVAILLDKNILKHTHFYMNVGWYGFINEYSFDSDEHPINSKEFRKYINMVEDYRTNEGYINLSEVMFDEDKINLNEYLIGFYFLFGNNYGDQCGIDYTKMLLPLNQFLINIPIELYDDLIDFYSFFQRLIVLIKKNCGNVTISFANLSNNCNDYKIKKYKIL